MTADFAPHLDILPPPQRRFWGELATVSREFVLYGGTALAMHLGHRQSLDFDFFGNKPLDPTLLVPAAPFLEDAIRNVSRTRSAARLTAVAWSTCLFWIAGHSPLVAATYRAG